MRCASTIAIGDNPYCLIFTLVFNQSDQNTILTLMYICKVQMTQVKSFRPVTNCN